MNNIGTLTNQNIDNSFYNEQDNTTEDAKPRITTETDIGTHFENKNKLKAILKSIKDRSVTWMSTVKMAFRSLCERTCKIIDKVLSHIKPESSPEEINPIEDTSETTTFAKKVKDRITKLCGGFTKRLNFSKDVKETSNSKDETLGASYETVDPLSPTQ